MEQNVNQPTAVQSSSQPQGEAQRKVVVGQLLPKRAQSGANWFLWIAGLSLVNTFAAAMGSHTRFIVGLGITQIVDAIVARAGKPGSPVSWIFDFVAAGVFVSFGLLSRKRHEWAFIVGMILYALDGLLFLLVKDVLPIAFHLFALYMIYKGLKAAETMRKLEAAPVV